jgi:copper(I)-binding protein
MSFKSTLLALTAALSLATAANAGDSIMIHDAYARSSTAQSTTGAVFLTVMNTGEQADRLLKVHSNIAKRVELHSNVEDANGVMKMMHLEDGIIIPAGGSHTLKRGGDHAMMMGLTQGLAQGDVISVTLTFENAGEITVEVPVDLTRKPGAKAHNMKHNTDG